MRGARYLSLAAVVLVAACAAGENPSVTEEPVESAYVPDLAATAQNVVVRSAQVKAGDVVLITGSGRDLELLENIAIEVQKLGAHSLISLTSDRLTRRSYDEVPPQYDAVESKWGRILNANANVNIAVDASESPTALAGVPAERLQARAATGAQLASLALQRGMRTVDVGNGLYPTDARATQYGLTRDELARQFWAAVNADPAQLAATGKQLSDILKSARQVRVTHANGTDITFALDTRQVLVNDGAVSAENVTAGGAAAWKYLPAGEVYARVAAGSASGRLIVDEYQFQGQPVTGLTIDVASGAITSITAASGGDALLAAYRQASGDGRERLSILNIGINPALSAGPDSRIRTWVPAGMVTLVFGPDFWAGGTNRAAFEISAFQPGSTVSVDGRVVVENGALRL